MLRGYKYRLYPTNAQEVLINKHIGACRFVYNLALETKNYAFITQKKSLSCIDLINQLPNLKKECEWLKELDSQALQQAVINLDKAFTQFFKHGADFPKFKSKYRGAQSFRSPHGNNVVINDNKISLPKFKEGIEFVQDRTFKGEIKSATISRVPTGKYYISLLVETGIKEPKKRPIKDKTAIGIDLGLLHFIVDSENNEYENPKFLKQSQKRLKVLQRRLSRKKKGSANRKKAIHKVAVLHEKISNQRKDFLHKLSTNLIQSHDTICCEDLAVKNMVKNHKLARSINDASWSTFVSMLKYKAEWNGKNVLQIPTFEASTKVCNNCGSINHSLTLADREWFCANCSTHHHRDGNAAKVIKKYCITKDSPEVIRSEPVEPPTLVGTLKQEDKTAVYS